MREFILYSRQGRTDAHFSSLREAGRLDVVHECIVAGLFLSHGLRRDVLFHVVLNGPPKPPLHLRIDGATLHDVRTDQETWSSILRNVLQGGAHRGIALNKVGFETLLKTTVDRSQVYVLEEDGKNIREMDVGEHPVFVLGDHIGLPRTAEKFALRYAQKVSIGKQPYLAASCITIMNYLLDADLSKPRHGLN